MKLDLRIFHLDICYQMTQINNGNGMEYPNFQIVYMLIIQESRSIRFDEESFEDGLKYYITNDVLPSLQLVNPNT